MTGDDLATIGQLIDRIESEPEDSDLLDLGESWDYWEHIIITIAQVIPSAFLAGLKKRSSTAIVEKLHENGIWLDNLAQARYGVVGEYQGSGFSRFDLAQDIATDINEAARKVWEITETIEDENGNNWANRERIVGNIASFVKTVLGENWAKPGDWSQDMINFAWFLAWCYEMTDNYYLDTIYEYHAETDGFPGWSVDNLFAAIEITDEARELMKHIEAGYLIFHQRKEEMTAFLQEFKTHPCQVTIPKTLLSIFTADQTECSSENGRQTESSANTPSILPLL